MEAFKQLTGLLAEARSLLDQVPTEQNKQARVSSLLRDLKVGFDDYGNRRVSEDLVPWANQINDEIKSRLTTKVEEWQRSDLERRAKRIEEIRAAITSLAAQASIELGCEARVLQPQGGQRER